MRLFYHELAHGSSHEPFPYTRNNLDWFRVFFIQNKRKERSINRLAP